MVCPQNGTAALKGLKAALTLLGSSHREAKTFTAKVTVTGTATGAMVGGGTMVGVQGATMVGIQGATMVGIREATMVGAVRYGHGRKTSIFSVHRGAIGLLAEGPMVENTNKLVPTIGLVAKPRGPAC